MKTLAALVSQAYAAPEWAVFFEVSNTTGFGASRRADAIAIGIWPSRGNKVIGFEFKEDRRDWLREKKNPAKAETIAQHCDEWFVVAGNADVVKLGELPEPWGLKVASANRERLTTLKPAVPFADRDTRVIARTFVSAMLRKVPETTVPIASVQERIDAAVAAAGERRSDGRELRRLEEENKRLNGILSEFKEKTGVNLQGWQGADRIIGAVDAVLKGEQYRQGLEGARRQLTNAAIEIGKALEAWPAIVREGTPA